MADADRPDALRKRLHDAVWPVVGIVITILVAWCSGREKRPSIAFVVTNQSHVLDVYWPQPDLQVLFRSEDIERDSLDLEILTVRIENRGQVDTAPAIEFSIRDSPPELTIPAL